MYNILQYALRLCCGENQEYSTHKQGEAESVFVYTNTHSEGKFI